ncbi:lipase 1-like [Malaya genurostris]|uniref:lipase 1-like n=1 Tax=Malaya genurostris TaxID=325434 RepID=UPI0026F3E8EC|nr:lipase 1-like [Malaya genurostris]
MVTIGWCILFACTFWAQTEPASVEDFVSEISENDIGTKKVIKWFNIDYEDGDLLVPQLVVKYGYQVESHMVTTEDGYMLTMFRILPRHPSTTKKFPVLMVHGFLGSSADFVVSGPNNSLAYLLADNGYDVWLANVRGTRYSRNHTTLLVDTEEYWDFSWHEIGYHDLPAMIDHVLMETTAPKLQYIGHSQGCTTYFVMSSTRPKYNKKIALMTALAPAVVLKRVRSPILRLLLEIQDQLKEVLDALNVHEIPYIQSIHHLIGSLCPVAEKENLCTQLLGQITGPHPEMWDQELGLVYMGHAPSGASTKQLYHFAQLVRSRLFRQYDYGRKGNLQTYSNWKPPVYNLNVSSAPVQIYYGLNDWMVYYRDVEQLATMIPRLVGVNAVADEKYNHIDFLLAKNARSQVYDKLLPVLEQYNNNNNHNSD